MTFVFAFERGTRGAHAARMILLGFAITTMRKRKQLERQMLALRVACMLHAGGVVGGIGVHHVGDKAARVHLYQHVFEQFDLAVAGRVEKRAKESRGRYGGGHAKISLLSVGGAFLRMSKL